MPIIVGIHRCNCATGRSECGTTDCEAYCTGGEGLQEFTSVVVQLLVGYFRRANIGGILDQHYRFLRCGGIIIIYEEMLPVDEPNHTAGVKIDEFILISAARVL